MWVVEDPLVSLEVRDDVGRQNFERDQRILHHPHRVTGVQARRDEILAGDMQAREVRTIIEEAGKDFVAIFTPVSSARDRAARSTWIVFSMCRSMPPGVRRSLSLPMKHRMEVAPIAFATSKPRAMF